MADLKETSIALLSSTSVTMGTNANGTKQILYSVPYGKDCVITEVVVRNPNADLDGCNDVDFGVGAACATIAFLNNVTVIGDQLATTVDGLVLRVATTVAYKVIDGSDATAANREFGIYIVSGATGAAYTATIDVFGYLF